MPVQQSTQNRGYPKPHPTNTLADDVERLRSALDAIDADVFARYTKTEVDQLISDLVAGAPGALNTLNELADALGDDANFASTVATQLALKANTADVYTKAQADARYVTGTSQVEQLFTAGAGQTSYTLTTAGVGASSLLVSIDGILQPTSAYTLSQDGLTLNLVAAPPTGSTVRVLGLGVAGSAVTPGDDTVTTVKLRDGAVTTAKLADGATTATKLAANAVTTEKIADGAITAAKIAAGAGGFESGTAMLFAQTSAPTGWTKSTTHNDKALRVVSGTASSGGTTAFSTVFTSRTPTGTVGNTTLTTAQMPSHNHTYQVSPSYSSTTYVSAIQSGNFQLFTQINTSSTGSGNSHNHSFTGDALNFAVQYVDVIIAVKD